MPMPTLHRCRPMPRNPKNRSDLPLGQNHPLQRPKPRHGAYSAKKRHPGMRSRGVVSSLSPCPSYGQETQRRGVHVFFIKFQLSETGEIMDACFKEDKITEAQFWPKDDEVIAKVRPSIRNPGKFEFRDLEKIDDSGSELELAGAEKNEDPF